MEEFTDFPIDYYNETDVENDEDLQAEAEARLRKLAKGNTDITGASIHLSQPAQGKSTSYAYEATVVVFVRPTDIAATEISNDIRGSLKGALDAVERQVRQKREKLRNH